MAQADFTTLDNIFTMWTPSDMVGTVVPNLGGVGAIPGTPAVPNQTVFSVLLNALQNTGRGIVKASDLKQVITDIAQSKGVQGVDLSQLFRFYSTQGFINELGPNVDGSKTYMGPDGSKQQIAGIQEIIGKDFQLPSNRTPLDVSLFLSNAPFFSPMTRGTRQVEIFLNSMPNVILSQLSPFLQVEFQMPRSPSQSLQSPGLLKFLLGSPVINKPAQNATDTLALARQVASDATDELDFAGMEMFTAPQTLVNPQPNLNNGAGTAGRYADVVDPFRPFASIESLTVQVTPAGAGFYTYKKATLIIKVHDRARLGEISDFLRPRVYSGVTCWLTYGWRAPDRPNQNPYFDYINNNMLLREAYGITNCGFTFDTVGQVTLTIELFTKGVNEMRQSKISDNNNDLDNQFKKLQQIEENISKYRQALNLDPQSGVNKELRPYIVLDAAEQGTFPPNLSATKDIKPAIETLRQALQHTQGIDADAVNGLITNLEAYYANFTQADPITGKMTLNDQLQTRVTQTIQNMFNEVMTGPDPFLPTALQGPIAGGLYRDTMQAIVDEFNKAPAVKTVLNIKKNVAVSFGKLFTVFALRNLISADTVHELQVFFYPLNDSCGPVSGMTVAEFPIDMPMFLDQYREYVIRNGGERITLEDFLSMVIQAQFLDPRALGYGMRAAYAPFDPKDPDAKKPDKQGEQDSALDAWGKKYGTFKQPTIEMMIEVGHPRSNVNSQSDILASLNSSAASGTDPRANNSTQIMRIHLYDKQLNPYKTAGKMLADITGQTSAIFSQAEPPDGADTSKVSSTSAEIQAMQKLVSPGTSGTPLSMVLDAATGKIQLLNATSNQRMKDAVSKMVPTIRFGSNGTTILNAGLTSHADPRVTSVNMQRSMTVRNTAAPNGSGEFGLPLRVIPAQLQMQTLGNPLAQMAQVYFIDFQTGTTLDNLYIVTGLTHTITPGKYETSWQFGYSDAYGVFEQAVQVAKNGSNIKTDGIKTTT